MILKRYPVHKYIKEILDEMEKLKFCFNINKKELIDNNLEIIILSLEKCFLENNMEIDLLINICKTQLYIDIVNRQNIYYNFTYIEKKRYN